MTYTPRVIATMGDLCAYFGADTPAQLRRRIYKDTECGAWISVRLRGSTDWLHDTLMDGVDREQPLAAVRLGSIVEGSDAEVTDDDLEAPITGAMLDESLRWVEDRADTLWHEANDEQE